MRPRAARRAWGTATQLRPRGKRSRSTWPASERRARLLARKPVTTSSTSMTAVRKRAIWSFFAAGGTMRMCSGCMTAPRMLVHLSLRAHPPVQVAETEQIPEDADRRPWAHSQGRTPHMLPADRYLGHSHPVLSGQIEDLGIERPAGEALGGEDALRRLPSKALQRALGILDVGEGAALAEEGKEG